MRLRTAVFPVRGCYGHEIRHSDPSCFCVSHSDSDPFADFSGLKEQTQQKEADPYGLFSSFTGRIPDSSEGQRDFADGFRTLLHIASHSLRYRMGHCLCHSKIQTAIKIRAIPQGIARFLNTWGTSRKGWPQYPEPLSGFLQNLWLSWQCICRSRPYPPAEGLWW